MCKYVGAACFIANTFAVTKRKSFRLNVMHVMSERVEAALERENVIVDWTRQSVLSAFEQHSVMFEKRGDMVCRTESSDKYFDNSFMDSEFNCGLSQSLVKKMQEAISSYATS